jgi:hypothetical protein
MVLGYAAPPNPCGGCRLVMKALQSKKVAEIQSCYASWSQLHRSCHRVAN